MNPDKPQIIIEGRCVKTSPCRHYVRFGDTYIRMCAPSIIELFKENNVELQEKYKEHFKKYIN